METPVGSSESKCDIIIFVIGVHKSKRRVSINTSLLFRGSIKPFIQIVNVSPSFRWRDNFTSSLVNRSWFIPEKYVFLWWTASEVSPNLLPVRSCSLEIICLYLPFNYNLTLKKNQSYEGPTQDNFRSSLYSDYSNVITWALKRVQRYEQDDVTE